MDESREIAEAANAAIQNLLPPKSRKLYDAAYKNFKFWCTEKNVTNVSENVMLAFFSEKQKTMKSSTLWAQYSMIKACISIYDNIDISGFSKLIALLKRNSKGYLPKKSKVLSRENLDTYLTEADDNEHLMIKVVLILGIAGACRIDELTNLSIDDIEDTGSSLIIKIPNTKNQLPRTFIVTDSDKNIHMLDIYHKYAALRPSNTNHRRFFVYYKAGKCSVQCVGKNTFSKLPSKIALFLKLPDASLYTGHCLRRSSATLLADAGANITTIKRHGGWRSTAVAESYIENSVENKTIIANQVLQGTSAVKKTINVKCENYSLHDMPPINLNRCKNVTINFN